MPDAGGPNPGPPEQAPRQDAAVKKSVEKGPPFFGRALLIAIPDRWRGASLACRQPLRHERRRLLPPARVQAAERQSAAYSGAAATARGTAPEASAARSTRP